MQKPQKSQVNNIQNTVQRVTGIHPFETQSKLLKSSLQSKSTSSLIHETLKNNIAQAIINSLEKQMYDFDMGSEGKSIDESPQIQYVDTPYEFKSSPRVEGVLSKVIGGGLSGSLINDKEFSFANVQLEPISGSVHQALISNSSKQQSQNKMDGVGKNTRSHSNLLYIVNANDQTNLSSQKDKLLHHQSLMSSRLSISKPAKQNFPLSKNQSQANSNFGSRRGSIQTKNINLFEEKSQNIETDCLSASRSPMFREYQDSSINYCSSTKEQRLNKIQQQKSRQNQIRRFNHSNTPREMIKDPMAISQTPNQSRYTYRQSVCENSSQVSAKQAYGNSGSMTLKDGEKIKNKNTCRQVYLNLQAKTARGTNQESKMFKTPKSKDSLISSIQLQPDSASSINRTKELRTRVPSSQIDSNNPSTNQKRREGEKSASVYKVRNHDIQNMAAESPNSKLEQMDTIQHQQDSQNIRSPSQLSRSSARHTQSATQNQRLARSPATLREEGRLFSPRLSEPNANGQSCRALGLNNQNKEREKSEKQFLKDQQSKRLTILNHKAKAKKIVEGIINQPNIQLSNKIGNVVQIDIFGTVDNISANKTNKQLNINTMNNQVETFDKDNSSMFQQYLQSSQSSAQKPILEPSNMSDSFVKLPDGKRLDEQIHKTETIVGNLYEIIDSNKFGENKCGAITPQIENDFSSLKNDSFSEPVISVQQNSLNQTGNQKKKHSNSRNLVSTDDNHTNKEIKRTEDDEILKKRLSLPNIQSENSNHNSKYRRSRRDRVHEFNKQISLRESHDDNATHKLIEKRVISHSQSQQELETLISKIGVTFEQTQNTNEVPSPQRKPPQPSYLNSEEKPVNFFSEQPDNKSLISPFDNQGQSYYSQRQSSLLKTPRLISKSRQYRQKTYSSNSKDESSLNQNKHLKISGIVDEGTESGNELLRLNLQQKNETHIRTEEKQISILNESSGELACQNMPVQMRKTVIKQSNTEYPLKALKEKTILKKEINLKDLDDTDTFIQLEKSIKDSIRASESTKSLQKYGQPLISSVQSPINTNENEQQGIINKSSVLTLSVEEERQDRSRKSSTQIISQNERSQNLLKSTKPFQNAQTLNENVYPKNQMRLIKDKIKENMSRGQFDMKLVRQLENEAAKVIQKWSRNRNKRAILPLKEGRNMSTQTYFTKEDESRFKNKLMYHWMLMNMAAAFKKKNDCQSKRGQSESQDESNLNSFTGITVEDIKEGSIIHTQASCTSEKSQQDDKILDKIKVSIVQNIKDLSKSSKSRDIAAKSTIISTSSSKNNKPVKEESFSQKTKTNVKATTKIAIQNSNQQKEIKQKAKK